MQYMYVHRNCTYSYVYSSNNGGWLDIFIAADRKEREKLFFVCGGYNKHWGIGGRRGETNCILVCLFVTLPPRSRVRFCHIFFLSSARYMVGLIGQGRK